MWAMITAGEFVTKKIIQSSRIFILLPTIYKCFNVCEALVGNQHCTFAGNLFEHIPTGNRVT